MSGGTQIHVEPNEFETPFNSDRDFVEPSSEKREEDAYRDIHLGTIKQSLERSRRVLGSEVYNQRLLPHHYGLTSAVMSNFNLKKTFMLPFDVLTGHGGVIFQIHSHGDVLNGKETANPLVKDASDGLDVAEFKSKWPNYTSAIDGRNFLNPSDTFHFMKPIFSKGHPMTGHEEPNTFWITFPVLSKSAVSKEDLIDHTELNRLSGSPMMQEMSSHLEPHIKATWEDWQRRKKGAYV